MDSVRHIVCATYFSRVVDSGETLFVPTYFSRVDDSGASMPFSCSSNTGSGRTVPALLLQEQEAHPTRTRHGVPPSTSCHKLVPPSTSQVAPDPPLQESVQQKGKA